MAQLNQHMTPTMVMSEKILIKCNKKTEIILPMFLQLIYQLFHISRR
jgi:hypothetical protein